MGFWPSLDLQTFEKKIKAINAFLGPKSNVFALKDRQQEARTILVAWNYIGDFFYPSLDPIRILYTS